MTQHANDRTPPRLVALTPGRASGRDVRAREELVRAVGAAIRGGVRAVLVREPHLEDGAFLEVARAIAAVLRVADGRTWLGIHDRVHLASAVGADAAHVGGRSLPPERARAVLASGIALGRSTHAGDDPGTLGPTVDFALHAPVFAPRSKDVEPARVLGLDAAATFAAEANVPVLALGGIAPETLAELARHAGSGAFAGAAVIGALWGSELRDTDGIEERARALVTGTEEVFP